ncbi:MAG: phage major capsid protein [Phycisphaeraceae bacterium]|nr:phage major capsid protein [Phycisphaeraceae bacterium]
MPESDTPTMNDVMEGLKQLRVEFDKKSPNSEKIEKIEKTLEKQEAKNQDHIKEQKSAEKREGEMKERMDVLETELARSGGQGEGKNYKDSDEYKALDVFVKKGLYHPETEQKAVLRTDSDVQGGFLVPTEMDNAITKKIIEVSAIRSIARVRTIGAKSLEVPVRNTIPVAEYEGEGEQGGDSTSTYENETLTAFRLTTTIAITMDMLMDSAFDMESEIMQDGADSFAQKEGNKFVVGTGHKQPSGFTVDSRVVANARISAASATIGFDDMMNLTGDLKTGYNPVYVFNRRTLAFLRTLKGGDGHPLWQPGMNGIVVNTINGFPYLIAEDMSDIASNSISVAFGDFARGYTIIDRTGMAVIRDELTQKKKSIVEFTLQRWNTGQVTLPEAIKLLKTKA